MKKKLALCFLAVFFIACQTVKIETPIHKNTSYSFEERAIYLVSKMTLEEKVSQMSYESPAINRLEIPAMNWWNECLHGVARAGKATVFPQAIGMSAMWDRDQMFKISDAISDEARAKHHNFVAKGERGIYQGLTMWTPNINIFRDPRWGRGMETYGEDPYLTGELAVPFIKGLQGNNPNYFKLIATAKHFIVHSGPESSRHSFDVNPSLFDMINTYSPHFEKVVKEAEVYSIMCAYNRFQGFPCCGNKYLSDLLRNDWGFNGYIVSDCWAIKDFYDKGAHEVVSTKEAAAAMALKAGTDLNCGDTYPALLNAVMQQLVSEDEINLSLERLFVARMKLGLFAPKGEVPYEDIPYSVVESEKHQLLALESARKSIVLLKNENNLLPLSKDLQKVVVIGPNANDLDVLLANYNGYPTKGVTALQGIKSKLPNAEVSFAQGSSWADGMPVLKPVAKNVLHTDLTAETMGLKAEYFSNKNFSGVPTHVRVDEEIDFTWREKAPFQDMNYNQFSVRWTGYLTVTETGKYALGCRAFSGCKIFLDDELIVSINDIHEPKTIYEFKDLDANKKYKIKLEYIQDNSQHAIMHFLWDTPNNFLVEEAVALAKKSDVVILCLGLSPLLEGEEMKVHLDGFSGGDRLNLNLPESQTKLMKKIKETGKPVVLVLLNGGALSINWEKENIPAILEAWYPGQAGGDAIADILFGDYNPSAKLPITFYKNVDDLPAFDNYDMAGRTYKYFEGETLFDFGFGLGYSNFTYDSFTVNKTYDTKNEFEVSVLVTNEGKMDGEEIVQLYFTSLDPQQKPTIRTLIGFEKVFIKSGQSNKVSFTINPRQFATINESFKLEVKPTEILLSIGGMQPNNERIINKKVIQKNIKLIGESHVLK